MSDIGLLDIKDESKNAANPQLPDQVAVTPPQSNTGAPGTQKPNIPKVNPPNVTGGNASFSAETSAIADLVNAKKAELSATSDAFVANQSVDKSAQTAISGLTDSNIGALKNIQKANSLPGGAQGKIAKILSWFDSDYSVETQATTLKINEQRASQISATAAMLKEQNNALPTLLGKVSEAQKAVFDAQNEANKLALQGAELADKQLNTKLRSAELGIRMSQEQREKAKFAIDAASTGELAAQLPLAQAGKGRFAGMGGFIEERLMHQQQAETALASAQLALKKGNREEMHAANVDLAAAFPSDLGNQLLQKAQASGSPFVDIPTGQKGPDGKEIIHQIPINDFQTGIAQSIETENKVGGMLAAKLTDQMNVIPMATNLVNGSNAFASIDPRATQISTRTAAIMQNLDPKNPQSVYQTGLLLKQTKADFDKVVADNASKYTSKEAQGAVKVYGETGKFDPQGGAAVVTESVGIPSLSVSVGGRSGSKFANAWAQINQDVAQVLAQQHAMGAAGEINSNSDAMAILAQLNAKPGGKEKIQTIAANILADPVKTKAYTQAVKGAIQGGSINAVLTGLAQQKSADPVWNEIYTHADQYKNAAGQIDMAKLFNKLEVMSIRSGGKLNYANLFLKGLENYAVNSDNAPAGDPSYTLQDHALVGTLFGSNPNSLVLGDLHFRLRALAAKGAAEMRARVNADITGQTERAAIQNSKYPDPAIFIGANDPQNWGEIQKKTGVNLATIPSATGTGLTVAQIKQLYPNGF